MDSRPERPLTVEEAKARLRRKVTETVPFQGGGTAGFLRRHPYAAIGVVLVGGYILGKSAAARRMLTTAMLLKL